MVRWCCAVFCLLSGFLSGQQVVVSKEINIKTDYAYDVLPYLKNYVALYRDKGNEKVLEFYDEQLLFRSETLLFSGKRKVNVLQVVDAPDHIDVLYAEKEKEGIIIGIQRYNENGRLIDTMTISRNEEDLVFDHMGTVTSADHSKTVIFTNKQSRKQFVGLVFDHSSFSKQTSFRFPTERDLDFLRICISNAGEVYTLFEAVALSKSDGMHGWMLYHHLVGDTFLMTFLEAEADISGNMLMLFDDKNKSIVCSAFYGDNESEAKGLLTFYNKAADLPLTAAATVTPFDQHIPREITDLSRSKQKLIRNFTIKQLLLKEDGSMVVVAEVTKEYIRRSQPGFVGRSSGYFNDNFGPNAYIDYYYEDILLLDLDLEHKINWATLLFKKQFSQDDDGIFSSYLTLKSPSRLRFLYNDEIKNSNTVSEYVVDNEGNLERNSILSTDYKNLKLRFPDGDQIGAKSFVVPSEKNGKLSIVKVTY